MSSVVEEKKKAEYYGGQSSWKLVLKATIIGDLSTLLDVDIYARVRTFVPRHGMIIKVRRVSVARLNHAAPCMIDSPRRAFPIRKCILSLVARHVFT